MPSALDHISCNFSQGPQGIISLQCKGMRLFHQEVNFRQTFMHLHNLYHKFQFTVGDSLPVLVRQIEMAPLLKTLN